MNTLDEVMKYIQTELAPGVNSDLTPDTDLFSSGRLDSTAMLDLILWVEETYGFSVQNEDLMPENFGTPRNIVDYVQKNIDTRVAVEE